MFAKNTYQCCSRSHRNPEASQLKEIENEMAPGNRLSWFTLVRDGRRKGGTVQHIARLAGEDRRTEAAVALVDRTTFRGAWILPVGCDGQSHSGVRGLSVSDEIR